MRRPAFRWSVASRGVEDTDQGLDEWLEDPRPVAGCVIGEASSVTSRRRVSVGGDEETRTPDPLLAKEMLCQLSYVPADRLTTVVGVSGLEPEASALSGQCSNQLS